MFYKQEDFIKHNKKFWDAFIDLKVDGWKAYSDALNAYTMGFYRTSLEKSDEMVEKIGTTMKGAY